MTWAVYYKDGSRFTDEDGSPQDAPTEFFICAVGYDEAGTRYIMHGWNYYRWDKESSQWWGMDDQGLKTRLRHNLPVYAYKEGFTVTKTAFQKTMDRAHRDFQ